MVFISRGILIEMKARFEHNGLTWVDLESPTHEEVRAVATEFNIEPMVAEELLLPSTRPRADFYPEYVYMIMHFPTIQHAQKTKEQEIDFVIGRTFIITTHYDLVDPLHKFSKVFEANSILDKSNMGEHAGYLFYYMLKNMYKSIDHAVEFIQRDLGRIEERIYSGHEVQMVEAISKSARDLLNLRQTIEPHRDVLQTLEKDGTTFFEPGFMRYIKSLANEYYRVHNHVMRSTESLHELRETNNSLLTTKQNETMRVLTIMALLTFPLALFVAIFDINAVDNPILGRPNDFWIIVGMVVTMGVAMISYFKYRKWL